MFAIACHAWNDDLTGGAFKVATDFARWLATQGHTVHYLCGAENDHLATPDLVDGVTVWRYPYPRCSGPRALLLHVKRMGELYRHVASRYPLTVVNGHSPLQYYAVARQRQRFPEARFSYTVHSPFKDELRSAGRTGWSIGKIASFIDGRCLALSDVVTTDSQYTHDRLKELYGASATNHVQVAPIWVDVQRFREVPDKNLVRARLGPPWEPNVPTLLSVRRLERRMGLDRLIDAVHQVVDEGFELRLLIGGSGSMAEALRSQIDDLRLADRVHLLGRVSEAQLADTFAAADCFVLPSTSLECFGLITLESYACGVPVIATPVAAIPEIVRQHSTDWLTADPSVAALAAKLRQWLRGELTHDPRRLRAIAESYRLERRADHLAQVIGASVPKTSRVSAAMDR